jgi:hypothetical protein
MQSGRYLLPFRRNISPDLPTPLSNFSSTSNKGYFSILFTPFSSLRAPSPAIVLPVSLPHFSTLSLLFYPEDGGSTCFRNAGKPDYFCYILDDSNFRQGFGFAWFYEQSAIRTSVFIMETQCGFCEVGSELLAYFSYLKK